MTQTTNGLSWISAKVFVSPDGSTWTNVSGFGASVAVSGGERIVGAQHTMDGLDAIVKSGKRNVTQLTVRYVYTEEAADPFEIIRAIHDDDGVMYAQFTPVEPAGFWFKTGSGILETPGYPGGEAGSGDIVMSEFVMTCAQLTKAAAST